MAEIITVEDYKHKKADVNGNKHSVKAKSQAGHIWVKDIMTKKIPKLKDTQLGILKIYAFFQKIQQIASDPGESAAGVT